MRRIARWSTLLILALLATFQHAPAQSGALVLQPGDVLRVQIWEEEDLSGEFPVDEDGGVTLPLLGRWEIAEAPFREIRARLMAKYAIELRNPSVVITPLRRVNILGEVTKPGLYAIDPTVTLAGAIALAEGTTPTGDMNRIRILRQGRVFRERIGMGETLTGAAILSGDQIVVERRSWFDRNSTFLVSALLSVTSIVTSLIVAFAR